MKFVKGMMLGTIISAGMIIMYNENSTNGKNKMIKKGKKMAKKIGII
jgi:hypothetical protein